MDFLLDIVVIFGIIAGLTYVYLLRQLLCVRVPRAVRQVALTDTTSPGPFRELFDERDAELRALGFEHWHWALCNPEPADVPALRLLRHYRHPGLHVVARVLCPFGLEQSHACPVLFVSRARSSRGSSRRLQTQQEAPQVFQPQPQHVEVLSGRWESLAAQWEAHQRWLRDVQLTAELKPWPDAAETCEIFTDQEIEWAASARSSGELTEAPGGAFRIRFAVAASAAARLLRRAWFGPRAAASAVSAAIPPARAAVLIHNWQRSTTSGALTLAHQLALFLGSVALFILAGALLWEPRFALILLAVIAFHELGHLLAMLAFGYRHVQMLMLPLVGGVAMGREDEPSAVRRAVVSLAGPLPGIVLGWILMLTPALAEIPLAAEFAGILLLVNYLNLLPVMPLDGGQLLRVLIPMRRTMLLAVFEALSALALGGLAWQLQSLLVGVIALVPLFASFAVFREARVLKQLHGDIAALPAQADLPRLEAAVRAFDAHMGKAALQPLARKAVRIDQLLLRARLRPAGALATTALLGTWAGAFVAPVALPLAVLTNLLPGSYAELAEMPEQTVDRAPFRAQARTLGWADLIAAVEREDLQAARTESATWSFSSEPELPVPASLRKPPATEAALVDAELRLGHTLPAEYRALLSGTNGFGSSVPGVDRLVAVESIGRVVEVAGPILRAQERILATAPKSRGEWVVVDGTLPPEAGTPAADSAPRLSPGKLRDMLAVGFKPGALNGPLCVIDVAGGGTVYQLENSVLVRRYHGMRQFMEAAYVEARSRHALAALQAAWLAERPELKARLQAARAAPVAGRLQDRD